MTILEKETMEATIRSSKYLKDISDNLERHNKLLETQNELLEALLKRLMQGGAI